MNSIATPTAASVTAPAEDTSSNELVHRRGVVQALLEGGLLLVDTDRGTSCHCELLQAGPAAALAPGDRVLILAPATGAGLGIVLGRIGLQGPPPAVLELKATEAVSIRCGESSLELRADGKVMLRGEDMLLRAKGTHRVRAGTVALN